MIMKVKTLKTIQTVLALICAGGMLSACTKWDEFKKYTDNGEINYSGKLDSVKILSGNERIKIKALLPADPKIVKARVFWNNMKDSVEIPIDVSKGRVFEYILPMAEGLKSFTLYTYNTLGNKSVPVNATGTALGSRYQNSIANRLVASPVTVGTSTTINWVTADVSTNPIFTELKYVTASGQKTVKVPVNQDITDITDLASSAKAFTYRTAYLPANSIDTFYTASQEVKVYRDVTSIYLSNTGPFTTATLSGRWGTLGAPWVTNAAAKNKGGLNGGYTADDGGAINWETYGNDPVVNGIVYQPSSSALPAGNYIVSFDEYSEIQTNSSVYCVAAAGGNGIPVLANLPTALGFRALFNEAVINTAAPSMSDTRTFSFTLTTPQVVSIGFLGNLASSPRGNYFRVKSLKLYGNN